MDLNIIFFNNVLTSVIKTHAHIPCRWHKLSRSGFLFGLVSKNFCWMLNLCLNLLKDSTSSFSKDAPHVGLAVHVFIGPHRVSSFSISGDMLRNFSLINPKPLEGRYFSVVLCHWESGGLCGLFRVSCAGFTQWLLDPYAHLQVNCFPSLFALQWAV